MPNTVRYEYRLLRAETKVVSQTLPRAMIVHVSPWENLSHHLCVMTLIAVPGLPFYPTQVNAAYSHPDQARNISDDSIFRDMPLKKKT